MCGFKPGDEVVCIRQSNLKPGLAYPDNLPLLKVGAVYTVVVVEECFDGLGRSEGIGILLAEPETRWSPVHGGVGYYCPEKFRKVQKRNDRMTIEAFMTIKDGQFEEQKRSPNKKKVEA